MNESIYRALKNLSARELRQGGNLEKEKSLPVLFYILPLIFILISLFLSLLLIRFGKNDQLYFLALLSLSVGYLCILMQPILIVYYYRKGLIKFIYNPLGIIFDNAKKSHKIDEKYINYLLTRKKTDLEKVLIELNHEKQFFEKRVSLMVGAIDKIGLFPGLVALFVSISKIDAAQNFAIAIAYAMPIMYLFGVYAHFLVSRISRHIALINYAIEKKS